MGYGLATAEYFIDRCVLANMQQYWAAINGQLTSMQQAIQVRR